MADVQPHKAACLGTNKHTLLDNFSSLSASAANCPPMLGADASVLAWAGMLMQKYSSPANASKALSNLVGVAGAHVDALDAQGMHDKLYFNWTAFTQPEVVTKVLDYSQARTSYPAGVLGGPDALLGRLVRQCFLY